jgi:Fe-S-cluster-containing dehydrogenase component
MANGKTGEGNRNNSNADDARKESKKRSSDRVDPERRRVLKGLAAQIALGGLAAGGAFAAPKNFNPEHTIRKVSPKDIPNTKAWLISDPMLCVGCKTCEMVCPISRDDHCQPSLSRVYVKSEPFQSLSKICVLAEVCRQCNMPDCYLACEYDALVIDKKTGVRRIRQEACVGCMECYKACPWDMIIYDAQLQKCKKCDLCAGDPACVKYCPSGALKFVSLI